MATTPLSNLRKLQRPHSWMCRLLALIFWANSFAPIAQASASDKVLLCTSQGYEWVSVDTPIELENNSNSVHCVFCLPISGDDTDILLWLEQPHIKVASSRLFHIRQSDQHLPSLALPSRQSRAPPLNILIV